MIVRPRPSLLQLFFVTQGSIVPRILPQVLIVAAITVGVVLVGKTWPHLLPNYSTAPFALVGIAISVFLNFRNSACYDRWWEARRHWGELILFSRTLSRQTLILPPEDRTRWLNLTSAFAHALVQHLRPGFGEAARVTQHLSPEEIDRWRASRFPPDAILRLLAEDLARLRGDGRIGDIPFQMLDKTLADMSMVQTTCERIRTTPVPFGYTLLLHRTAYLFCFLLPFGFAEALGWATLLATILVAYTFFGLDALGDELEEPFGLSANNLPLSALAEIIELNMREALGETDLPPLPQPVNHVLI
jgi:putative membrane protein